MRTATRLRLIRIVAGVLVVLGFGVAVILTLNSNNKDSSTPPGNPGFIAPTPVPTSVTGAQAAIKIATGMLAVAVPYQPLPGIAITSCSVVDIIQLDANHNPVTTFSHVLVLRQSVASTSGKSALIVQTTPANVTAVVAAANQPYGVQVSLDGQAASGDCTP